MKLSTMSNYLNSLYGEEKMLQMIAEAGFDAVDYSMFIHEDPKGILQDGHYRERAEKVRKMAANLGLSVNQCHAPYRFDYGDPAGWDQAHRLLRRSLEAAGIMGVKNVVVHPLHYRKYAENAKQVHTENLELYRSLMPLAEEYGITICSENMWQWNEDRTKLLPDECAFPEEFAALIDEVDSCRFGACLDLGHAAITAKDVGCSPAAFIEKMGTRLKALHVHDNDGVDDLHLAPYMGETDWNGITEALRKIGYEGDFTFEADSFLEKYPQEFLPTALKFLHDTGRALMAKILP